MLWHSHLIVCRIAFESSQRKLDNKRSTSERIFQSIVFPFKMNEPTKWTKFQILTKTKKETTTSHIQYCYWVFEREREKRFKLNEKYVLTINRNYFLFHSQSSANMSNVTIEQSTVHQCVIVIETLLHEFVRGKKNTSKWQQHQQHFSVWKVIKNCNNSIAETGRAFTKCTVTNMV